MVGDYSSEPFNPGVRENTVDALAVLHRLRGLDPDTMCFHKEDPQTSHKDCPGKNVDKAELIAGVKSRMQSDAEGEHVPGDDILGDASMSVGTLDSMPAAIGEMSAFWDQLPKGSKLVLQVDEKEVGPQAGFSVNAIAIAGSTELQWKQGSIVGQPNIWPLPVEGLHSVTVHVLFTGKKTARALVRAGVLLPDGSRHPAAYSHELSGKAGNEPRVISLLLARK
jgi:hypothetical protein